MSHSSHVLSQPHSPLLLRSLTGWYLILVPSNVSLYHLYPYHHQLSGLGSSQISAIVLCAMWGGQKGIILHGSHLLRDEHMHLTALEVFSRSTQAHVHTTADCFWTNEAHLIYSYLCWANCNTLHTTGNVFHEFKLWFPLGHVLITVMAIWLSQKLSSMCPLSFLVWGNMCIWAVNLSMVLEEAILWPPPTDKSRQRISGKAVTFDQSSEEIPNCGKIRINSVLSPLIHCSHS